MAVEPAAFVAIQAEWCTGAVEIQAAWDIQTGGGGGAVLSSEVFLVASSSRAFTSDSHLPPQS